MKEIDPNSIIMTFKGVDITGVADGTFVEVEYDEDAYTHHVGAKGEVTRVKNANEMGTVTFNLGQGSTCNDKLSAIAIADRKSGAGIGKLLITDLKGTTKYRADKAWIRKMPKGEHGKEHTNRGWVVTCEKLIVVIGGSLVPDAL
jgi:hypothetical protein